MNDQRLLPEPGTAVRKGDPPDGNGEMRLFIECTNTYVSPLHTGIQRVVRNVTHHCRDVGREFGIHCSPVVFYRGDVYAISGIRPRRSPFLNAALVVYSILRALGSMLKPLVRIMTAPRLRAGLKAAAIELRAKLVQGVQSFALAFSLGHKRPIRFRAGDVILVLDSSWRFPVELALRRARGDGAVAGFVLYDLIPTIHPRFVAAPMTAAFEAWLASVLRSSEFCLTTSRAVKAELRHHLSERFDRPGTPMPVASFSLGAEMDRPVRPEKIRNGLTELLNTPGRPKPYLVVSTIEARKNQDFVVDAFERVWDMGIDSRLFFIGRKGSNSEPFLRRARNHPRSNSSIFLFHDLNDAELEHCYRNATALLMPSAAEGFGLPIVEALRCDLPVFASDIPVFQEVGARHCIFFGLDEPAELASLIADYERNGRPPPVRPPGGFSWIGWKDSCRDLIRNVLVMTRHGDGAGSLQVD